MKDPWFIYQGVLYRPDGNEANFVRSATRISIETDRYLHETHHEEGLGEEFNEDNEEHEHSSDFRNDMIYSEWSFSTACNVKVVTIHSPRLWQAIEEWLVEEPNPPLKALYMPVMTYINGLIIHKVI